jgi:hypothetical protein
MLRKAIAASASPADDIRLWLGVHDLSRVEWTAGVPLPAQGQRRYHVEFSVEIPANTFSPHETWEHLQIFTRLQSPSEEGPVQLERDDLDELRRGALGVAHRLKMLRNRVERSAADALSDAGKLERAIDECVGAATALVHEARRQLYAPGPVADEIAREVCLADELISHHSIEVLATAQRALDQAALAADDFTPSRERVPGRRLAELLTDELRYRDERAWVTPRADAPAQLTAFVDRASQLKKHFQDELFLEAASYFVDRRSRNWVAVVAAALAATAWLSFTLLPIGPGTRAGLGLGTFAVAFALAYAVKDRIKEFARGWITGRLTRLYGQRVVSLRLPARIDAARPIVCQTHETIDVENHAVAVEPGEGIGRPRRVVRIAFCMRAELEPAPALRALHIDSVKHIFRYDLSPIFARLDDAVKPVPVVAVDEGERRVRFCDAPREYRFRGRVAYSDGGAGQSRDVVIVVTKRGIERIEAAGAHA